MVTDHRERSSPEAEARSQRRRARVEPFLQDLDDAGVALGVARVARVESSGTAAATAAATIAAIAITTVVRERRALANHAAATRPHAAPIHAPRARVAPRKSSSSTTDAIMGTRASRLGDRAAAARPKGTAMAIASPAGLRLPNVEPGVLMTGIEKGRSSTCCKRPIPATAAAANVIASKRRHRPPVSSTTLAAQANPKRHAHRAVASSA